MSPWFRWRLRRRMAPVATARIDWVQCERDGGETVLRLPFESWQLAVRYRQDPLQAVIHVRDIIGMLCALSIAMDIPMRGGRGRY